MCSHFNEMTSTVLVVQIEHNYHRLTLPFPVSVDCPSDVTAVTDNGNVAVAIVDSDDYDRRRSYKYVRA